MTRARADVAPAQTWGLDDPVLLSASEAAARLAATRTVGATYTPHCAVLLHERTRVTAIEPGRAVTERGVVTAEVVVRATEGYTATLPGLRRAAVPVQA